MVLTANNAAPSTSQYGACGVFLAHLIDKAITTPAIVIGGVRRKEVFHSTDLQSYLGLVFDSL